MTKTTKQAHTKKARIIYEGKPKQTGHILTGIIGLVIIIFALFLISNGTFFILEKPLFTSTPSPDEILVTINDEAIYITELNAQWDALPVEAKISLSRTDVLDRMIEERLLLQEAKKVGINVTDADVELFINNQLATLGVTPEMFAEYLTTQGITQEEVLDIYRQQLTIAKLFDDTVGQNITVSQEEIEEYYTAHQEEFVQDEMVTVRHILIQVSENFNEAQAQIRVGEILGLLKDDFSNFCALVTNYSMDLGSTQNCGEYTFSQGQFNNPAFEDPAFAMAVNELKVINTTFGLHIMLKTAQSPRKQLELDDAVLALPDKPSLELLITSALTDQKAQVVYDAFIDELLAKSDIVYEVKSLENIPETPVNAVLNDSEGEVPTIVN